MNTTLARETRHPVHHEQATRRVSVLDRAALHVGVALIKWGRRPGAPTHERRVNRIELALLHRDRRHALASLASEAPAIDYTSRLAPLR